MCFEDLRIRVFGGFENYGVLRFWGTWCLRIWGCCVLLCFDYLRILTFWEFWNFLNLVVQKSNVRKRIMVCWGFQDYSVLRIWGFSCFEYYGVLRTWRLWCFHDLRIRVFWGFEGLDVLRISGLGCFKDISVMCFDYLWILTFWEFRIFFNLLVQKSNVRGRIMMCWVFEDYIVFWGFEDLRIWGLLYFENLRILMFWGSEDYGVLKMWRFKDYGILRILGLWCS